MKMINDDSPKKSLRNVRIGENVKIFDFVNAYECQFGDNTKIGTFVEVQKNVVIGANCKISSHSFICEGVIIEDGVFIGHNVSFINDKFPRAINESGLLQTQDDWVLIKTIVEKGASIGTGSTIMGGITIGKSAIVGAGSVVTKNVPENAIVAGNPAKILRYIK
jgi:UDP-2-acetamido-3-amino-2,3-dideoxy-glucuronate N-acetyltransferase